MGRLVTTNVVEQFKELELAVKAALPTDSNGTPLAFDEAVKKVSPSMIKSGSLPFIFGVISRSGGYGGGYGAFTSQLGRFYNGNIDKQLNLITGYHGWGVDYRAFSIVPTIQYLTGSSGSFNYKGYEDTYADTSNRYQYPKAMFGLMFVKNTTDAAITRTLWVGGSSRWSSGYEGMGLHTITPNGNNDNIENISSLSYNNVWAYTGNTWATGTNVNIMVPANTTIAVLLYSSAFYHTNWNGYQFNEQLVIQNARNFFGNGLEMDIDRTVKAHTNPDGSNRLIDIWK